MSKAVKRNGLYASGKQRWLCLNCGHSFSWRNPGIKHLREQVWFRRWITEGYSARQLANQSGHSRARLYRIINHWLKVKPARIPHDPERARYLVFDGTFIHRPMSLVTVMDGTTGEVFSGKYGISENSESGLTSFFQPLVELGLRPVSFTVDGNPQAIRVLRKLWPDIIIQRCLVHIQRQGLMWCRRYPRTAAARQLRNIFLKISYIRNQTARDEFLELFNRWEEKYGRSIESRPEKGRVFSDIKRARSMLLKAVPDMFHYLDDPAIPFSTNGLEGYFSRLKSHYRQHRGLSPEKLDNYFAWYIFFNPR